MYVLDGFTGATHSGSLYALQLSSESFSVLTRCLVHMRNAAQRWFKLHNVGASPHRRRSQYGMASDGTRVFVLGESLEGARVDEMSLIHVFDTSMYFRSVISP
jgi:hypothetical protein